MRAGPRSRFTLDFLASPRFIAAAQKMGEHSSNNNNNEKIKKMNEQRDETVDKAANTAVYSRRSATQEAALHKNALFGLCDTDKLRRAATD